MIEMVDVFDFRVREESYPIVRDDCGAARINAGWSNRVGQDEGKCLSKLARTFLLSFVTTLRRCWYSCKDTNSVIEHFYLQGYFSFDSTALFYIHILRSNKYDVSTQNMPFMISIR